MPRRIHLSDKDSGTKVWRYLGLASFLDILERNSIFFPLVEAFEDPYEGMPNAIGENDYFDITNDGVLIRVEEESKVDERVRENTRKFKGALQGLSRSLVKSVGVSCWRISNSESHAMWKIFLKSGEGVAIQTTLDRLVQGLVDTRYGLIIGKVVYLDYTTEKMPIEPIFTPFFHKNIYFKHEEELRVCAYRVKDHDRPHFDFGNGNLILPDEDEGFRVRVNTQTLLEKVIISPYAPAWFGDLVRDVLSNQYAKRIPIEHLSVAVRRPPPP